MKRAAPGATRCFLIALGGLNLETHNALFTVPPT
jgi:hypothetical protein